jgi:hypothetical protein
MMEKLIFTCVFWLLNLSYLQAQLFRQDFESSTTLTDYFTGSPNNQQFTSIGVAGSGANGTVSISTNGGNQLLQMQVASGSDKTCFFNRTTDFDVSGSPPTTLIVRFDMQVPVSGGANTSAGIFRIGAGFTELANIVVANANIYSRFSINLTANSNEFQIRDISSMTNSVTFSGKNTITWVLNNSGSTQNYFAPNGATLTVANDTYDIWVGNTLVFNDFAVLTPSQTLSDMKFVFDGDNSTLQLDNFLISENLNLLPVTWLKIRAQPVDNQTYIFWETADEKYNQLYEVERADKSMHFIKIGERKPTEPNEQKIYQYHFIDNKPLVGYNYYRIKQIDINGVYTYSKIASWKRTKENEILLAPNPASDLITIYFSEKKAYQITIINALGQVLYADSCNCQQWKKHLSDLQSGTYLVIIISSNSITNKKLLIEK